jgi:large subunit ribosomal protein L3
MPYLLGQKIGMTQVFAPDGATVSVTLVHVPVARVTYLKTIEKDGYAAVQVGTRLLEDEKKASRFLAKPQRGHLKASNVSARSLYEFRLSGKEKQEDWKLGQELSMDMIAAGDAVQIRGTSKGRGFAGVVKRHHFAGGPASHGHKDNLRAPGSIGAGHPQHVIPGTRMAGHMGDATVSLKNVEVIGVDAVERVLMLKGGVPGALRSWLEIHPMGKKVKHPISERKVLAGTAAPAKAKEEKSKEKAPAKAAAKPAANKK